MKVVLFCRRNPIMVETITVASFGRDHRLAACWVWTGHA